MQPSSQWKINNTTHSECLFVALRHIDICGSTIYSILSHKQQDFSGWGWVGGLLGHKMCVLISSATFLPISFKVRYHPRNESVRMHVTTRELLNGFS